MPEVFTPEINLHPTRPYLDPEHNVFCQQAFDEIREKIGSKPHHHLQHYYGRLMADIRSHNLSLSESRQRLEALLSEIK